MRLFLGANITLFIGYWVFLMIAYSNLPDQIPMHFGADGEATRYSGTSIFSWFIVPIFFSIILLPILYTIRVNQKMPLDSPWYNYPFKERILKLDRNQRQLFRSILNRYVRLLLHATFFWMILLVFTTGIHKYLVATASGSLPILSSIIVILLLMGVHVVWLCVRLTKILRLKLTEAAV